MYSKFYGKPVLSQESTERSYTGKNMNSQLSVPCGQKGAGVTEDRRFVIALTTTIALRRPQPGAAATPTKEAGYRHPGETQDNAQ